MVLAVVIVICCRKDRRHGRVFKQKKNKPRSGGQGGGLLEAGPEPSGKLGSANKMGCLILKDKLDKQSSSVHNKAYVEMCFGSQVVYTMKLI